MYGYIKIGAAVPSVRVADCKYNSEKILVLISDAARDNVKLLVFPELCVTGCTCGDLFFHSRLISESEKAVRQIAEGSREHDVVSVIGAPVLWEGGLYNCGIAIFRGEILGIVPIHGAEGFRSWTQTGLREFSYIGGNVKIGSAVFKCANREHFTFAIETGGCAKRPAAAAAVIVSLASKPACAGKSRDFAEALRVRCNELGCAYVYSSPSVGESSATAVYDGQAVIAAGGKIIAESSRFSFDNQLIAGEVDVEDTVLSRISAGCIENDVTAASVFSFANADSEPEIIPPKSPYLPEKSVDGFYQDIFDIQTFGLYKRLSHTGIRKTIIGVSGGLDSTLALLAAVNCHDMLRLPRESVLGITMPGFGTTGGTYENALKLMKALRISVREIPIKDACVQHFKDIGHGMGETDAAFENAQARERTQILMDIANMENGIVVGTGDMSELALGWATYNGDHMSMYGLNGGIPKTVVRGLVSWYAERNGADVREILMDILGTPVSPELLPASGGEIVQKTEDLIGPYELHDFFIYYAVYKRFSPEKTAFLAKRSFEGTYSSAEIRKWLKLFYRRFFTQQFKRSCSPDYPKALEFGLSQATDLNIPSDADGTLWYNGEF